MSKSQELLEAHLEFELNSLSESNLRNTLQSELTFFVDWLYQMPVEQILSRKKILEFIRYYLIEHPIEKDMVDLRLDQSTLKGTDMAKLYSYLDRFKNKALDDRIFS